MTRQEQTFITYTCDGCGVSSGAIPVRWDGAEAPDGWGNMRLTESGHVEPFQFCSSGCVVRFTERSAEFLPFRRPQP